MNKLALLVGDFMVDRWIVGESTRMSAEAEVPIVDVERDFQVPGGAGNVKSNLVAMGCTVHTAYNRGGCEVKNRLVCGGVQVARWDSKLDNPPMEFIPLSKDVLDRYDALVVSDYGKGGVTDEVVESLRGFEGHVFIDTKGNPSRFNNQEAIYFPNLSEYNNYKLAYDKLKIVVVTLGADGCMLMSYGKKLHKIPQHYLTHPVRSVCGAGDVVVAAAVACYNIKNGVDLNWVMAAAACAVEKQYTPVVTLQEINNRLEEIENEKVNTKCIGGELFVGRDPVRQEGGVLQGSY